MPLFHFTLYTEMLPQYLSGRLDVPPEVTVVWTDDNDGRMRALPRAKDRWKHGVYYHLAYFSTSTRLTKQITHLVTPMRVEEEFRKIVDAGATEYMLVNVSELREYVMEARMLAEICWDAPRALAQPGAAERYVDWWSREYFGDAAQDAARSYRAYYQQLPTWDQIAVGANAVADTLTALEAKFSGMPAAPSAPDLAASLDRRARAYDAAHQIIAAASVKMPADRRQFFYEHVAFPLLLDSRQTAAAVKLLNALSTPDRAAARTLCLDAFAELKTLELEIAHAERPPFEQAVPQDMDPQRRQPVQSAPVVRAHAGIRAGAFAEPVAVTFSRQLSPLPAG